MHIRRTCDMVTSKLQISSQQRQTYARPANDIRANQKIIDEHNHLVFSSATSYKCQSYQLSTKDRNEFDVLDKFGCANNVRLWINFLIDQQTYTQNGIQYKLRVHSKSSWKTGRQVFESLRCLQIDATNLIANYNSIS